MPETPIFELLQRGRGKAFIRLYKALPLDLAPKIRKKHKITPKFRRICIKSMRGIPSHMHTRPHTHFYKASIKVTLLVQSKYFSKNHISKTTVAIELILEPLFC